MTGERVQRRLAAILAVDVVGYSRLMEADETGTLARLKRVRSELLDARIIASGGRIVKTMGDGVLAELPSAVAAVEVALAVQRDVVDREAGEAEDRRLRFRVGINLGDVIVDGDDIHGDGVNIAARLESMCGPGEVYVSGSVFEQVARSLDVDFEDLGERSVKNIARPIRVFRAGPSLAEAPTRVDLEATLRLPDKPSLAVLPFATRGGGNDTGYLAEGIAEDIITKLSKLSGLFVIGGNSSARYRNRSVGAREVGRELDVRYVLEGAVQRAGERVRVSVKLVDSANNRNVWVDRYDRDLADIFELQDDVAGEVVNALELELSPAESARLNKRQGGSLEVYTLYQQARAAVNPPSRANTLAARSILQQVVRTDPAFAPGFAGLSMSHARTIFLGHSDDPDTDLSKAFEYAAKALALDSTLGICHSARARACFAARQFDEAVVHSERAISVQPGDADSYGYLGVHLSHADRASEGVAAIKRAIEIEPTFIRAPYFNMLGFSHWAAGQYEEAVETLQSNIDRGGPPHTINGQAYWTACLVELDRQEDARQKGLALRAAYPEFSPRTWAIAHWYKNPEDTERLVGALLKTGLWIQAL